MRRVASVLRRTPMAAVLSGLGVVALLALGLTVAVGGGPGRGASSGPERLETPVCATAVLRASGSRTVAAVRSASAAEPVRVVATATLGARTVRATRSARAVVRVSAGAEAVVRQAVSAAARRCARPGSPAASRGRLLAAARRTARPRAQAALRRGLATAARRLAGPVGERARQRAQTRARAALAAEVQSARARLLTAARADALRAVGIRP